jgi:hypothetical protein
MPLSLVSCENVRVHVANSESWRVSVDEGSQSVHVVLYIRDAFHLAPKETAENPPRLSGEIPDLRPLLVGLDLSVATFGWTEWWKRLMAFESARAVQGLDRATQKRDFHATAMKGVKVFDPPGFESLTADSAIQSIAASTFRQAHLWHRESDFVIRRRLERGPERRFFADVADEVRDGYNVSASQVNASVLVLQTVGAWRSFWPGLLVCSQETFANDEVFAGLLREAFIRNIDRSHGSGDP